ncbi:MAG: SAM-dependent chlorinase/fluorinase [Candidatus Micrarchaeota archaeon]|nr:SAM-dependent chlorinase/fluorinase [Candidatus Micrarchaeota archaeon]
MLKENERKNVVIISDCKDIAYNEMRAVILKEIKRYGGENRILVEPLVPVKEMSVINCSFSLRLMAEIYEPKETVFVIVVNPLKIKGEKLVGETENGFKFVSGNTGAINWLIEDFGIKELYQIKDKGFLPFGGKYSNSPLAAKISCGKKLSTLGDRVGKKILRPLEMCAGTIVHIDNFGLIKFKGKLDSFKEGDNLDIFVNGKKKIVAIFSERMMNKEDGVWVLYKGSSLNGMPELGKVRDPQGAEKLGVKIGDVITWKLNKAL